MNRSETISAGLEPAGITQSEVLDLQETMKAIAVLPGQPNSIHLREVRKPRVSDVPNGRGVLVKILRVGVDGTDKEINAAEYGAAPKGDDFLILGHESFRSEERRVGKEWRSRWAATL